MGGETMEPPGIGSTKLCQKTRGGWRPPRRLTCCRISITCRCLGGETQEPPRFEKNFESHHHSPCLGGEERELPRFARKFGSNHRSPDLTREHKPLKVHEVRFQAPSAESSTVALTRTFWCVGRFFACTQLQSQLSQTVQRLCFCDRPLTVM